MSWSGSKDSAMALHLVLQNTEIEVIYLLTTVAKVFDRISHHGVRPELLHRQAESLNIPLHVVYLPGLHCTNAEYESITRKTMLDFKVKGVLTGYFTDLLPVTGTDTT